VRHHHPSRNDSQRRRFRVAAALLLGLIILCTAAYAISVVWTRTANGSANAEDRGQDITLAPNGDLYAVGYKGVPDQVTNIWIRKFSPTGITKWTRSVDGPASNYDWAYGAATDSEGNLYVVGSVYSGRETDNIWIRKYNSSGDRLWTRTVNGLDDGSDSARGTATDSEGNIYVVGYVTVADSDTNIWVRKYSSSGTKLWTRIVAGSANSLDAALGAAVDSAGNLFVVGYITVTGEGTNIWIRKYNSSGVKLWTRTIDGPASAYDRARGAAIDPDDNLYVVGTFRPTASDGDIWIRKYSPSGAKLWTRTVAGAAGDSDEAHDAAVDANGAVYVIGTIRRTFATENIWMRKYSAAGVKRWTTTIAGPDSYARGHGVAVDATKRVYATGAVFKSGQEDDIWIRKYRQ